MKRFVRVCALILALCCLLVPLVSCGGENDGTVTKLSFKSAASYDYLRTLDGKTVSINGYLATSSPADGSFIFLMNLPYQSCPFCKPNTSELSNTMEVYPKNGKKFSSFTTSAVKVTGTLKVAPQNKSFTDPYGYEFNFKIVDADYTVIDANELTEDLAVWQKIADSGIITEINSMYEYVNFVCAWNTYFINTTVDGDGVEHKGYYLYAADALRYLDEEGAQFAYGREKDYFDKILSKIRRIDDSEKLDPLIANVGKAKVLAEKAYGELKNGNYTYAEQYVEKFDTTDYVYTINLGEELKAETDALFAEFSDWLGAWEV